MAVAILSQPDNNRPMDRTDLLAALGPKSPALQALVKALATMNTQTPSVPGFEEWTGLFRPARELVKVHQQRIDAHKVLLGMAPKTGNAPALFVIHTAYALLVKLLAARVLEGVTPRRRGLDLLSDSTDQELARLLRDVDSGRFHEDLGLESGDTTRWFSWAWEEPSPSLLVAVRKVASTIRLLDPTAGGGYDLVQPLYEAMVPTTLRRNLGEFYTPRWLVEATLDQMEYAGAATTVGPLLDPCCGSGGFVSAAIARFRHCQDPRWPAKQRLEAVLSHVMAGDLNPLAVLACRLNYLRAIADLLQNLPQEPPLRLPVFHMDAVAPTPFAPEAPEMQVAFIASNPPWVRWSSLPLEYRTCVEPACRRSGILPSKGFFGGGELDISGVIAYLATQRWLVDRGRMGFVITGVHFQVPSSENWRHFELSDGTPMRVMCADDMTALRPFPGAANQTVVFTWIRGERTSYPVAFRKWTGRRPAPEATWDEARAGLDCEAMEAHAVGKDGRWAVVPRSSGEWIAKFSGESAYVGRKGVTTDLNGAYFFEVLSEVDAQGLVWVRNLAKAGRTVLPTVEVQLESELLYPLLKGSRSIGNLASGECSHVVLVPNENISRIASEDDFRGRYPHVHGYFSALESETGLLTHRSTYRTRLAPLRAPFYAIYNVGPYTFAPFKVVWAEMPGRDSFRVSMFGSRGVGGMASRPVVPDHKVYFVGLTDEDEAHFVAGFLSAEPVRRFLNASIAGLQAGTLLQHVRVPRYDPTDGLHVALSRGAKDVQAGQADAWGAVEQSVEKLLGR